MDLNEALMYNIPADLGYCLEFFYFSEKNLSSLIFLIEESDICTYM